MGIREPILPAVDAGVIPTQFVSGMLPPRLEGGVWITEVYECRGGEKFIVARFAMTEASYRMAVAVALGPVADALGVFQPRETFDC